MVTSDNLPNVNDYVKQKPSQHGGNELNTA